MTTRYKTVPGDVKDERFSPHIEVELSELADQKQRKGEAVGEEVITMKNVAHKTLKNIWIQTTTTKIPHGLGNVPSDYTVIVKEPIKTIHRTGHQFWSGYTDVYHELNAIPKAVIMTEYVGTLGDLEIGANYDTWNKEYIKVHATATNTQGEVTIWAGTREWLQASDPDRDNLYLRAADIPLKVDIIVKE